MLSLFKRRKDENIEMNGWEAEVDISHNLQSEDLFARKIWQLLYPAYLQCGDTNNFDNFLCDLKSWAYMIRSEWNKGERFVKFYWCVNGSYTDNNFDDVYARGDDVFEIIVDTQVIGDKKIIIKKRYCQIIP